LNNKKNNNLGEIKPMRKIIPIILSIIIAFNVSADGYNILSVNTNTGFLKNSTAITATNPWTFNNIYQQGTLSLAGGTDFVSRVTILDQLVSKQSDGVYIGRDNVTRNRQLTNVGETWVAKDSNRDWRSVSISSDSKYQTAVVRGGLIYVSSDYGNTWVAKDSNMDWYSVSISSDGKYQTAVIYNGQIYVSRADEIITGGLIVDGSITASNGFYGSGANLTNITAAQVGAVSNSTAALAAVGGLTGATLVAASTLSIVNGNLQIRTNSWGGAGIIGANGTNASVVVTNTVTLPAGSTAWASNNIVGNTNNLTLGIPGSVTTNSFILAIGTGLVNTVTGSGTNTTNTISVADNPFQPWSTILTPPVSSGTNTVLYSHGTLVYVAPTGTQSIAFQPIASGGWTTNGGINRVRVVIAPSSFTTGIESNAAVVWANAININTSKFSSFIANIIRTNVVLTFLTPQ